MLKPLTLPAALLAALAFAVPASAQAPSTDTTPAPVCTGTGENGTPTCTSGDQADQGTQTVGGGQVITDPAGQVDGPTVPSDGDGATTTPKQGEVHVMGSHASATAPSSAPADPQPVSQPASVSRPSAEPVAATPAKELPFTGIDAGPLVALGVLLLGGGLALRRLLAVLLQPVQ